MSRQENSVASQSELENIQLFAQFSCLFDWKHCHLQKFVLSNKMAEKPNEEANSQSSQLAKEEDRTYRNSWVMVEILPVVAPWPAAR